ncbi:negative regulation of toll-like receptor 5 signaling pathway [Branchiostoma belcheri]|nr:negative regulation of toll-like receptor 5 signaling pathway [Branchiostoma belcheri]
MPRSPSFVDSEKTRQLWDLIVDSIQSGDDVTGAEVCYLGAMTGHSLVLPCVSLFPLDFQEILNKQLIDRFMQKTLEEAKVLNWCRVSRPLTPVQNTGDGNCLLHAVSQYMWGIHDRALVLRMLLNRTMVADMTEDMKRRWNRSCKAHNQHVDLEYVSLEWRQEWNIVVSMTDPTPNPPEANDLPYKSLEEFHIFVLANLLRRPIIILAEDVLHNFEGHIFAPIHFSGIYLPLRWKPEECVRSPIVLGYLQQHFTPLLSQEEAPAPIGLATGEFAVPLVKHDLTMLTVQFLLEHEENQAKELLQKYLDLMELPYTRKESISMVLAAKLNLNPPPEEQDFIKDFFQAVEKFYKKPEEIQEAEEPEKVAPNKIPPPAVKKEKTEGKKLSSAGCDMYRTLEQNGLCTKCFRESTVSKKPPGPAEAPALPADVVPNSSMLMRECRTPGCQYFCSIATGEYCHECYEKNTGDQRRREVEAGRATQTEKEVQPPAGNPNKCITERCNNDSNPDYENLCDVCFINVVTKSGQPPSVHPLKQTERSSRLGIIPTTPEPLHSVENRTNSQSLGLISDFTRPTKCIIPECPRTGYPKTNDMCKNCYIDQQGRVAGAVAAAVTTVATVLTHLSSTFTSAKTSTPGGSPTCMTVGCEMFGAPGQDGYCSQCYLIELGKKSRPKPAVEIAATQQTVATAPQRPAEEVHPIVTVNDVTKAKYYKKCKTPDCQKIGHETTNGLCHGCYPKDSNTGRIPDKGTAAANLISSGPEELVPTGAEGSTNPQISTQSETRPLGFEMSSSSTLPLGPIDPQTGDNNSTECLIEGCTNMKLENTGGRCYWCLKKGKIPQTPKPVTKSPTAPSSSSDPPAAAPTNIVAAAAAVDPQPPQPIPSLVDRKQCPAPHCDAYGDAMYNGLCSKCFHTLKEYHSKKPAASPSALPNGPHHSSDELPAGNTIITAGHEASVVVTPGNVTVTTEEGGTVSVARTTIQVPDEPQLPCVNAALGCEMFGTKEQMGFCFQCFGKHINQQAPVNHPPQPANQHQEETPLRVLAEVAGQFFTLRCQVATTAVYCPGCDMHGEPDNLNMCSKYLRHLAEVHRAKDIEAHRAQNLHTNVEPPAAYPPRVGLPITFRDWKLLEQDTRETQRHAFTVGTQANHRTQFRAYLAFCHYFNQPAFPASAHLLACYAQFLSRSLKSPDSISHYLSAVKLLHQLNGFHTLDLQAFELKQTLRGLKKTLQHRPREARPVTPELLHLLQRHLDHNKPKDATIWTILLIGFFAYFRKSNLVPPSAAAFDPRKHLRRRDITSAPEGLILRTSWSKTIQANERELLAPILAIPGSPLCPVAAYKNMIHLLPAGPDSPAFILPPTARQPIRPVTASILDRSFKRLLTQAGLSTDAHTIHDLRRGGYTLAFEAGVPRELRQHHGDWRSNADLLYLKLSMAQRLRLPAAMRRLLLLRTASNPDEDVSQRTLLKPPAHPATSTSLRNTELFHYHGAYNPVVPEPQPTYAPPAYHNRQPCATPNCPNDGHPDQENLCAPCFQKFMSLMTPQQAATKWEPQAAYQKCVTQQQTKLSALKNCRAEGCENYGNSRCFGFCHGCYQANYGN